MRLQSPEQLRAPQIFTLLPLRHPKPSKVPSAVPFFDILLSRVNEAMIHFNIEVVSDTICPWGYVGKKMLEQAIALFHQQHPESQDTFSITWIPYYLNVKANAPRQSVDKAPFFDAKLAQYTEEHRMKEEEHQWEDVLHRMDEEVKEKKAKEEKAGPSGGVMASEEVMHWLDKEIKESQAKVKQAREKLAREEMRRTPGRVLTLRELLND